MIKTVPYEGKTVQSYVDELYPEIFEGFEVVASVDGGLVDPYLTIPNKGSFVVFCLAPADADIGRMVAMLAVIAISLWVPGLYPALSTFQSGMLSAGIMIGGTMLVNALLPPILPGTPDGDQSSPSYSWSGVNIVNEGYTAPVIYGTIKVLPYFIGKYAENIWVEGYATPDKQRLHLLCFVADHAVDSISSIKINGNIYSGYSGVSVATRLGTNDQTVIENFRDTRTQQGVNIKTTFGWMEFEVPGSETTAIGIGVSFPTGLGYCNDEGNIDYIQVYITVQFALVGTSNWQNWIDGYTIGSESTALRWYRRTDKNHGVGYGGGQNPPYTGAPLSPGSYKVRFRSSLNGAIGVYPWGLPPDRYIIDQYIDYVEGITIDDFTYPGASLLSVDALATDQLSGGLPTISCIVTRSTVAVHDGAGWTTKPATNPAWAAYDMVVNAEYGGGVPYTRMVYADFLTWATFCDLNSYTCNIVFDVTSSFPEALGKIGMLGRGQVVQKGTKFGVIVDKTSDTVQLFGMGDIVEGSFKQAYVGKQDRTNIINVSYLDEDKDYERLSFELRTSDFDTATNIDVNPLELTLYGATDKTMSVKQAKFLLNCNEYLIRLVEFEVGVGALASNIGENVYVAHDVPQYGYSGHVVSATSNTITLDQEVTQTIGLTYHVLVRHYDDDDLEEVAVVNPGTEVAQTVLTLIGTWDQTPAKDDTYAFGEITKVAKVFRITNITRSHQMRRKIQALEYRAEVYSDSATIPDYESETALYPYVAGLVAVEVPGLSTSIVNLTWRGFGIHYLYIKEADADQWKLVSTHTGDNWAQIRDLAIGKTYYFAISTTANPMDGVTASLTFKGVIRPRNIWGVSGLQIVGMGTSTIWQNKDLKLTWNLSTDLFPIEAGNEELGAGTFPPMADFGGFRIRILNSTGTLRKEIIQVDNNYTYTFELNSEDGTPASSLIIKVWARDRFGQESESPATISVSNPAPSAPSGLTATPWMKGVKFIWQPNTEIDISYYTYRIKVETDSWSDWVNTVSVEVMRSLTETEEDDHTSEALIYFEVKAIDTFGNESSVSSTSATTFGLNIQPTDIDDFGITASKIFTKIPVLEGDSWTDNSPSAGRIAWNAHTIYYNGVGYSIEAGNTDLKYIFWINGNTAYSMSDTNPTLTDDDFIIVVNIDGVHDLAWNAIANQVIGSAYIENLAVSNEHVSNLDADKIKTGTLEGINIIGNTIRTSSDPTKKAIIITSEGIALYVPATIGKWGTFKWGDGTQYGTGFLGFIHHSSNLVPFCIQSEQIVADFHFYNRGSDPTGVGVVGDTAFSEGKPKYCTGAGTPGTWKSVLEIEQQAHEADAVTSHSIADTSETVDRSDIEAKLDALGTKINNILSKLETTKLFADS